MKLPKTLTERQTLLALMGLAFLICLPMVLLNDLPGRDVSYLYAPMIREFAAGNWEHAFYHRLPPLFPVVGGLIAVLGFTAFTAAKIASTLFFCLTLLPLYYLHKLVWDRRVATVACLMFVFCSRLLQYAGLGHRCTAKTFFLALTAFALAAFIRDHSWRNTLFCAVSAAGLTLVRSEGIILAVLVLGLLAGTVLWPGKEKKGKFAALLRPAAAGIFFLVVISPWLAYEYRQTGYLVTDSREIHIYEEVKQFFFHSNAVQSNDVLPPATVLETRAISRPLGADNTTTEPLRQAIDWKSTFEEGIKGLFPLYLVFVIPVLVWRFRQRKWTRWESYLLAWLLGHNILFWGLVLLMRMNGVLRQRHLIAATPLMFGWGALGLIACYRFLVRKFPRRGCALASTLISLAICSLVWRGTKKARPLVNPEKRQEAKAVSDTARWLREIGRQRVPERHPRLKSSLPVYHNGRLPILCSAVPAVTFLSGSDGICPSVRVDMSIEQLQTFCAEYRVNFVVVDRAMLKVCPNLVDPKNLPADFSIQYAKWHRIRRPVWLIGYTPNLRPERSPER